MTAVVTTGIAAAMAQSIIFIGYDLIAKQLRVRGFDPMQLTHALRHALLPSLLILAVVWDGGAFTALLYNQTAMLALGGFLTSALLFQWVYFKCLHVSHSLAVASVTRNAIGLPLLMVIGIGVNGDQPTVWGVCAIALMVCASFLRPGRSKLDRSQYIESTRTVIWLSLAFVALVTIKDPLYRLFLQNSESLILGIALYMVIFSAALHAYFWAYPIPMPEASAEATAGSGKWLLWAVPAFWIGGTIPEGIAFGLLPVYSLIAIGTLSWIIIIAADVYFKRLAISVRTAGFTAMVLASIGLSIVDRQVS